MTARRVVSAFLSIALMTIANPGQAAPREIKCSSNVVACLKEAFQRCPKNVTYIADRSAKIGFRVLPRGTPITKENIKGRPTYTVCTPK